MLIRPGHSRALNCRVDGNDSADFAENCMLSVTTRTRSTGKRVRVCRAALVSRPQLDKLRRSRRPQEATSEATPWSVSFPTFTRFSSRSCVSGNKPSRKPSSDTCACAPVPRGSDSHVIRMDILSCQGCIAAPQTGAEQP